MRYDVSFFGVFVGAKYIASITELQSHKQSVDQNQSLDVGVLKLTILLWSGVVKG